MGEPSDARLLRESLEAPARFERIFERHYDAIRRYTHRRVGMQAGEDLAAQTFLTAFSARASFDGRTESCRGWLFGIANNMVSHHLRAERSRLAAWSRLGEVLPEPDVADAARLDAIRAAPMIESALESLREDDREAFLLFALAELSYEEVAEILRIPIGTVRSKIFRVRQILRERLGAEAAITDEDFSMETPDGGPD